MPPPPLRHHRLSLRSRARRRCPGLRDEIFQCYWTLAAAAVQLATAPLSCALGQEECLLFVPLGVVAGVCCFMATVCVFAAVWHLGVAAQPSLVAASFVSFSLRRGAGLPRLGRPLPRVPAEAAAALPG